MRSLLFDDVPVQNSDDTVRGSKVYQDEIAKALLQHGAYESYYFLSRSPHFYLPTELSAQLQSMNSRARLITIYDLDQLKSYEEVVLFSPGPFINSLIPFRCDADSSQWPATGVIHSLDHSRVPYLLQTLLHADLDEADMLICSSEAGKRVVEKMLQTAANGNSLRPPAEAPRFQLPIVPLGTDSKAYDLLDRGQIRRDLGIPDRAVVVLFLGRLSPTSKCDLWPLLHAFGRGVRSHHEEARLVIAGSDPHHRIAGALTEAAEALGCGGNAIVRPNTSEAEKRELLAAADIFVSPSDNIQETFGLTIIEAMAAGLPVVASDWNGYKELIAHNETGFRVPTYWVPMDGKLDHLGVGSFSVRTAMLASTTVVDVDALGHYLRLLVRNADLRKRMGELARQTAVQRFDWSVVVRGYESVWDEALATACRLRKDRASFARCPSHYSCQGVFGHYPTGTLSQSAPLSLSPSGQWFLNTDEPDKVIISPHVLSSANYIRKVLELAAELGPTAVLLGELANQLVEESGIPFLLASSYVSLSLKYGFLKLASDQAQLI